MGVLYSRYPGAEICEYIFLWEHNTVSSLSKVFVNIFYISTSMNVLYTYIKYTLHYMYS